jgi:hypothetical protein
MALLPRPGGYTQLDVLNTVKTWLTPHVQTDFTLTL